MNLQEFSEFEQHPELSVLARLMYAFYLKKQVMRCASSRIPVTHAGVQAALALQLSSGEQSQPEPVKIEAALAQLASTKLVTVQERQEETVWVELPLCPQRTQAPFAMTACWQPLPQIQDYLKLYGIMDAKWEQDELHSFVVYWLARPDAQETAFVWTQKFAKHIQYQRSYLRKAAVDVEPSRLQATNQPKYEAFNRLTVEKIKRDFASFNKVESDHE